ncbi:MAG: hypothetical protein RSB86_18175 [Comamonas sp.]|uniref:hypothetical protein n=1 Tax=Comamonas sp. TaxID=34028 RepID=UPI002FC8FC84
MDEHRRTAIDEMENVDIIIKELCSTIDVMSMGAEHMDNGEWFSDVLNHIKSTLQNARAELDDATSAVMRMRETA